MRVRVDPIHLRPYIGAMGRVIGFIFLGVTMYALSAGLGWFSLVPLSVGMWLIS